MDFKLFLNKTVKLWEVGGWFRQGEILEAAEDGVLIRDRKDGIMFISINKIANIKECRE